jgi:hypothetical protein
VVDTNPKELLPMDEMNIHPTTYEIRWNEDPAFRFDTEVDALMTLQDLGQHLKAAREQVRQVMRYMTAAVQAARTVEEDGDLVSKEAIIGHSGLSRRTVYAILGAR